MIITLKNADFSLSNIGTLSTWRIARSLGAGATYEGPTSVDKSAAFSATVTLAEGYEIGTAGVSVTMGGVALSGVHSISGNVITITIASVTGNVLIKVPTVNTSTGEEDSGNSGSSGDNGGEVVTGDITHLFEFIEAGGVNYGDGTDKNDNNYQRTGYVDISAYDTLEITQPLVTNPQTPMGYAFYDENKVYITGIKNPANSSWSYEVQTLAVPAKAKYIRVMWYDTPHPAGIGLDAFSCIANGGSGSDSGDSGNTSPDSPVTPGDPSVSDGQDLTSQFTWSTGSINATTGGEDQAADWVKSDYVSIAGATKLDLMMIRTTSGSTTKGMAFYDANKNYISGVKNNLSAPSYMTPELRMIDVPANATYMRTSWCSTGNSMYNPEISNINHFYCIVSID